MLNQEIAKAVWHEAKKHLPPLHTQEDGLVDVVYDGHPYHVEFEWWGKGCVYDAIFRGVLRYRGGVEKFADDYDWMGDSERKELFLKELQRRLKSNLWPNYQVAGYGWEHPGEDGEVFPGNDYCSVGYVVLASHQQG